MRLIRLTLKDGETRKKRLEKERTCRHSMDRDHRTQGEISTKAQTKLLIQEHKAVLKHLQFKVVKASKL